MQGPTKACRDQPSSPAPGNQLATSVFLHAISVQRSTGLTTRSLRICCFNTRASFHGAICTLEPAGGSGPQLEQLTHTTIITLLHAAVISDKRVQTMHL